MGRRSALPTLVTVAAAILLTACGDGDDGKETEATSVVLDPAGVHYGKSYGEWGASWWKWLLEMERSSCDTDPNTDPDGSSCTEGQDPESPVFFLSGKPGGIGVRDECVAPAGKALFYPIVNVFDDDAYLPPEDHRADEEISDVVKTYMDNVDVDSLFASVDGVDTPHLEQHRSGPTRFTYTNPAEPNFYTCAGITGVTEGPIDPSFSDGFWMMLSPPEAGEHVITFGGVIESTPEDFTLDMTYHLTIE